MTTSIIPAFAEEGLFNFGLEQLLKVEVTLPSRQKQNLQQAPSSITVFSRADITRLGITNLEELLNYVSGVEYHREGQKSQVTFRGRRSLGNDILVLMDGMRLNDPVSASAFNAFPSISLAHIEKVEIIKGPGSALYGSNAYNGVISLTSLKNHSEVTLASGRFGSWRGQGAYHRAGQDWQIDINAERFIDDGQHYEAFFDFSGHLDPTRDPLSGDHLNFGARYGNWSLKMGRHHRLNADFVSASQANGINLYEVSNRFSQLGYDYIYSDQIEFTLSAEQVDSEQSLVELQLQPEVAAVAMWANGAKVPLIGGNYREVQSRRFTLDASWQQNDRSLWHLGAELRREHNDEINFQGNWDPDINRESNGFTFIPKDGPYTRGLWWFGSFAPLVPESTRQIKSVYLQNNWQWLDNLTLTAGAHFDDYDDVGNNLSLRSALVWQQDPKTTLKLLYGEAFRAPTLFELNALLATGLIGNAELKPETVATLDLVWLQDWGAVQSTLTYYHSSFDDVIEIILVDDVVAGFASFQPQNQGGLTLSGWEFELAAQFSQAWSSRLSYAKANEFVELGAAQQNASLSFNYKQEKWHFNLSASWHSAVLSRPVSDIHANAIVLDDYWLGKAHLVWQWSENIILSFTINNLFNRQYKTYTPINGLEQGSPDRNRNWQVAVGWQF